MKIDCAIGLNRLLFQDNFLSRCYTTYQRIDGAMREKRLLERLRAIDENPDWRGDADPQSAIVSVLKHLDKILNTRQGSAQTATDLGMPDFTSITGSMTADTMPELAETLTQVILNYEPRLTDVRVTFEPELDKPLMAGFKLSAKVRVDKKKIPVVFETLLNSDGHITVME